MTLGTSGIVRRPAHRSPANRLVLMKERVDIHQIPQEVLQMLGHEIRQRGIQVTTALGATKHWVVGDPTRLRQVFWNLLGNAFKFSDPGER
jgi:signal transduction histidine kinase